MRKFFIIVAFIICFLLVGLSRYDEVVFAFKDIDNPKYYFYVRLNSDIYDSHYIKNGQGGIICLDDDELNLLNKYDISTFYGASIEFSGNEDDILKLKQLYNVKTIKIESFDDVFTIYGYSENLGDAVTINGEQINIQIAKHNNTISVGFPILLGSY